MSHQNAILHITCRRCLNALHSVQQRSPRSTLWGHTKSKFELPRFISHTVIAVLLVTLILLSVRSVRADDQGCYNLGAYYCGGTSNTPPGERCYPRVTDLTVTIVAIDTLAGSQYRLHFDVRYSGTGFHEATTAPFWIYVTSRVDSYASRSVDGWASSNELPYNVYNVCYTINRSKCTTTVVQATSLQVKFWANACQKDIQGYCKCGCESDTVRISGPFSVGQVASLSDPQPSELGDMPCEAQVGDPINTTNGNMYQRVLDASLSSDLSSPLQITRHYNTFNFASSILGKRWRFGFENTIALDSSTGNLTLIEASGRQIEFERHSLGGTSPRVTYDPPYGIPYRIKVDTINSVYTVVTPDDTKLIFHQSGPVDSTEDLAGNKTRFHYTGGLLDSVTDASGRRVSMQMSGGRLQAVTSSAGDTLVHYDYHPSKDVVQRATYSDGSWEQYGYGSDSFDSLSITEISTSDGTKRYFSYDSSGLATSYSVAGGSELVTLDWTKPQVVPCGTSADTIDCTIHYQHGAFTSYVESVWSPDRTRRMVAKRSGSDCGSCATSYTYDGNGMKRTAQYANGQLDSMFYDSRGNLVTQIIGANTSLRQRTEWKFDSTFNRATLEQWTSLNKANDYGKIVPRYDAKGNITRLIETGFKDGTYKYNDTSWFTYNAAGQLTKADGPRRDVADTVKYTYYGNGDLQYVIGANADTTLFGQRNLLGHRTWVRSSDGDTTRYAYDNRGRLTKTITLAGTADSAITLTSYNVNGSIRNITAPNGAETTYHQDSTGYMDRLTDQLGDYTSLAYDSMGNQVSRQIYTSVNTLRLQGTSSFNRKHQSIWSAGPYGDTTRFGYGPAGTLDTILDALGYRTVNRPDSLRRLSELVQPRQGDSIKTKYSYDSRDNTIKVTDPDGNEFRFKFDDKGRVTRDSCALTGIMRYGYDAADNLVWKKNAAGDSIDYEYDALNRLTAILYPDSQNVRYQYDGTLYSYGKGRLYKESAPACSTTFRYDIAGRLWQEIRRFPADSITYTTSYEYDRSDRLASITYPSGNLVAYAYDTVGNVTMVRCSTSSGWDTLASNIAYAPFGSAENWTLGNGITITNRIDQRYFVDSISTGVDSVLDLRYTYNVVGNITEVADNLTSAKTRTFGYDRINQLTTAQSPDYPDTLLSIVYSRNGNRDTVISFGSLIDTSAYSYSANKLAQISDSLATNFVYDPLGNVIQVVIGTDTTIYQYNDAGRLVSVDDGATMACTYDGQHQRVSKTSGGVTTKFINLSSGAVLSEFDNSGWKCDYIYLNGMPLARLSAQPSGDKQYYITDHLGTPIALTNDQKTVTWRGDYYPFGEVYDEVISSTNSLRFPGQYEDAEADIYYNWHRYYSPKLGRYLQSDPLGPFEGNLYGYANGNPLRFTDPLGLFDHEQFEYDVAQALVGFGDRASFGLTKLIRQQEWYGGDYFTDSCSKWYQWGAVGGDFASAFVVPPIGKVVKGINPWQFHNHHMIPWEFVHRLPKSINIDDYVKRIPAWLHVLKPLGIHTGKNNYNALWRNFLRQSRSEFEIINFMNKMDRHFKLRDYPWLGR